MIQASCRSMAGEAIEHTIRVNQLKLSRINHLHYTHKTNNSHFTAEWFTVVIASRVYLSTMQLTRVFVREHRVEDEESDYKVGETHSVSHFAYTTAVALHLGRSCCAFLLHQKQTKALQLHYTLSDIHLRHHPRGLLLEHTRIHWLHVQKGFMS